MTRISIYSKDVNVTGNDRWIGSDAQNQNRTKNFTPDNVATYFNENQVIDLGVELRYFYDTLDPLQERVFGSITFETEIGPQVNFSAISTFILSKYTMGHTDVSQFLDFLIGSNVLLSRANNINMFGYYKIDNIEPYLPDPNFFVVTLTFDAGNGYMKEDEDYFISLVQFEQTIPEVPTKTSDLINDGEDGVHPFITAEDVTTPTLQSVTDEGNTTTNDIVIDSALYESIISNNYISTNTKGAPTGVGLLSSGVISFGNGSAYSYLSSNAANLNVYFNLPNKASGTYTIATTSDIPVVTGFVPYTGATGNVNIGDYNYIGGNLELNGISTDGGSINLRQSATNTISGDGYTSIYSLGTDSVSFYLANNFDGKQFNLLTNSIALNDTLNYTLPSTSGTIALISDIPTKTSDLTNDGEDGVNPFITAADIPSAVTSVGLTMPSAFTVTNSPITSSGDIAVTGAGVVSQYVRGDGSLANFPTSTGGGASLSFYLNGSVSQGTIGGVAFREMDRTPILGAGTDFTIAANGYIQSFITDANVPNLLEIPAGNWNFETYFSASSGGGSPSFYVELYKWDGATLSLIASNSATPEGITNGTAIDAYFSALAVPQTTLLATDRLAIRIYVTHSGRTIKLHTEDNHLCQVVTTFSTGLTALNGLTTQVQSFATGTSGTDFGISSATSTHTFNLPTASAANRGALSSTDWSTFNGKFTLPSLTSGSVLFSNGTTIAQDNAQLFWDDTNNRLGIGTATPVSTLQVVGGDVTIDNNKGYLAKITSGSTLSLLKFDASNNCLIGSNFQGGATNIYATTNTLFYSYPSSVLTERMRIVGSSGNLLINSTTDAGFKLDVNGTARVSGAFTGGAAITATTSVTANNGNGFLLTANTLTINGTGSYVRFNHGFSAYNGFIFEGYAFAQTTGETQFLQLRGSFAPTSGTATFNGTNISPTINQTGGANGITRGLYINPTLTAAADFRAIHTTRGKIVFENLPTSATGLPTGAIWNDAGTLKIV